MRTPCKTCKYAMGLSGARRDNSLHCGYALLTDSTALKRVGMDIVDTRGEGRRRCKLYEREEEE